VWGPASGCKSLTSLVHDRETKVSNFDVILFVEKNVLQLEVSVTNSVLVEVFDSVEHLLEEFNCFTLGELFTFLHVIEELSFAAVLGDEKEALVGLEGAVALHQVWVLDILQYFDFSSDSELSFLSLLCSFVDNFDGDLLPGGIVLTELHRSVSTFTEQFSDLVVSDEVFALLS